MTRSMGDAQLFASLRALDEEWIQIAGHFGFEVHRASGSFVSYDGRGKIIIAPYDELDMDDCLAQIILHELCHFATEGDSSAEAPDWGLDNETDLHEYREFATLRAQAVLVGRYGLRGVLAPTTDFRVTWDTFVGNPLQGPDREVSLAQETLVRMDADPRWERVAAALQAMALQLSEAGIRLHEPQ